LAQGTKLDLRGTFGGFLGCYFFNLFSGNSSRKRGFQIYYTNLPMFTIKSLPLYIACHDSLDPLFQNLGDLDSKA
jgi:hypothetical protein